MTRFKVIVIVLVGICMSLIQSHAQKTVSIESLLKEMIDRDELAKYPNPHFTCKQFSSYDRASISPDKPGWFANNDCSMFIRVEEKDGRKELVMADAEGPGAIVRFWMTFGGDNPGEGIMRIYVDDYSNPVIEGSPFEILSGNLVTSYPLAASVSDSTPYNMRGHNLYFPIPYAQRCKITYESKNLIQAETTMGPGLESVYFNINYRTYDVGTKVISYSASEIKRNKSLINNILKKLKEKYRGTEKMKLTKTGLSSVLQPGQTKSVTLSDSQAIRQIDMKLCAGNVRQALRSTVMEIVFDGEKTVWVPVGDFFGIGYHNLYSSTWYTQVSAEGDMSAFWVMPFKNQCVITLHNLGDQTVEISDANVFSGKWNWDECSMHFGVSWQQYTHATAYAPDYVRDINFVTLQGKGVYVGDGVAIFNTSYGWWGEGDEKVYVDGEEFPSHFGTGSEDYYGYAWCLPAVFTDHPFISQPLGTGSFHPALSINTRYRSLDGIPFEKSIRFDMELFQTFVRSRFNYAPVSYWYILPGGRSLVKEDIAGAKEPVAEKRSDIYKPEIQLTIEGENLTPANIPVGKIDCQMFLRNLWSDAMQLFWSGITVGNRAEFTFDCSFPGRYIFTGIYTVAPDYGTFNIYINEAPVATNLNLNSSKIQITELTSGQVNLKQGKNTVRVELIACPDGRQDACFGIDKLIFEVSK